MSNVISNYVPALQHPPPASILPRVYRALLTQTGTNAPVATVLENTLGGTVVWTRTSTGTYVGTLSGAFPSNKVFPRATFSAVDIGGALPNYTFARATDNTVGMATSNQSDPSDFSDANISFATVEILVYN